MLIVVRNAVTGGIIGIARTMREARSIAEDKSQPYCFEIKGVIA